ncbi:MAG: metal-dependent hydrolase [Acidimicrobiales bacterium]
MSKSATLTKNVIPARTVKTRRIAFEYPTDELPRHFINNDIVMSHIVSTLSAVFPEGEDFFVNSVRNYRDQITDPELKKQVAGFIGQEAMHSREHERFNERLAELGYPTLLIHRGVGVLLQLGRKVLPKKVQLAITAALEHYTSTLAEVLLVDPAARGLMDVEEVQSLFLWHALEESEHKTVAFDVYEEVCGNHFLRAATMTLVTLGFVGGGALMVIVSMLATDSNARNPRKLRKSLAGLKTSPWLTRKVGQDLRAYNRKGFHPDDHDNKALTQEWREKLFAAKEGTLTPRLAGSGVSAADEVEVSDHQ